MKQAKEVKEVKEVSWQVLQQLEEFQSRLQQMEQEASRERSEKEALRKSNLQLQMQVDKLLKIAASRTVLRPNELLEASLANASKSDSLADAEACLERRIFALESSQASSSSADLLEAPSSASTRNLGLDSREASSQSMPGLSATQLALARRHATEVRLLPPPAPLAAPPPPPSSVVAADGLLSRQCSADNAAGEPTAPIFVSSPAAVAVPLQVKGA